MAAGKRVIAPRSAPALKTSSEADALVASALESHRAGRLDEAGSLYARALLALPTHVDALNLSGALAFERGKTDEAIRLIGKAVRLMPSHVEACLNLAEALENAGRTAEAIDACRTALLTSPDFIDAHARLARLHGVAGESPLALAHARVALALAPKCVEALCARGAALRSLSKTAESEAAYRQALEAAPNDMRALIGLGAVLNEIDAFEEAEQVFRRAVALVPADPSLLTTLGEVIERSGDVPGAMEIYDRALALSPGSAEIACRRACCLRDGGEFDLAEAEFGRALTLNPDHALSLHALARMGRLDSGPVSRRQLARLIADASRPAKHRVQAGFALGELLDRAGDSDAAFGRFAEANATYARLRETLGERFDRKELRDHVDLIDRRLAGEFARDTAAWGNPTELPVFIVGMPRSGTTLVEQICASHSEVVGAGELRAIHVAARAIGARNLGREHISDWDAAHGREEADKHAATLARLAGGARRVVDKTPLNLMRLGIAEAMFPNARVIWCRRDPRDVVVSNHTLYFGWGNLWSTDQSDCAYAARQIERLGQCWLRESKSPILEVVYEDLVADLETHVPKIIDFLGLDWEPDCLRFHETDRHVTTPSTWQVRQPVYSTSVGRWRRFEKHLGPMLATLASDD